MRLLFTLTFFLLLTLLAGCSKYGEGDKVFVDITEGGIEQSAYIQATVVDEADGKVKVHIDNLHCETACSQLGSEAVRRLLGQKQAVFLLDQVKPWEEGKAVYDERMGGYTALLTQRQQQGIYYRVAPELLATTRTVMQRDGFRGVLDVIALAEFEQKYFTESGAEKSLREVIESFPAFFSALKTKLEQAGLYQETRRLHTEADLSSLRDKPNRLYLTALYRELNALQGVYQQYLLPKAGDDMKAMSLHFYYVDNQLADDAAKAIADFYSNDCQALPPGKGCDAYRTSFRQRAMRKLAARLHDNLAREVAAKHLTTEQQRVNESMSLLRFVLNVSAKFGGETLLGPKEIDRIVRENSR